MPAAKSRAAIAELADEQAALRRVATLVAQDVAPAEIFAAVSAEVDRVFGLDPATFDVAVVGRFEPGPELEIVGISKSVDVGPLGSRWPPDDLFAPTHVLRTGRSARIRADDVVSAGGEVAELLQHSGYLSQVASPIVVDGRLWGAMLVTTRSDLPPDTEERLERFTELVATALANAESRAALSQLADEQAALRRVATMVARAPASEQLFSDIAREVASVLDVPGVIVTRYEADGTAVTFGEAFGPDLGGAERFLGVGTSMPPDPGSLAAQVLDTQGPARVDDFSTLPGTVGELARAARLGSGCAGPIVVNGTLWGKMCVFSRAGTVLPGGTEDRLHDFIELVATAIANYEARADRAASEARAGELADEQAALRRVATLVAEGAAPTEVFDAVIAEVGQLLGAAQVGLARYENEHEISVLAIRGQSPEVLRAGVRLPLDGDSVNARILRTGRSARLNFAEDGNGSIAEVLRRDNVNATVGAPIVVDGAVWGMVGASWRGHDQPPADAEERLAQFAELLDTAIANADSRDQLMTSRARVIAAADESRRRIERDLHDGAQQRLITLTAALRRADAKLPPGADELRADLTRVAEGLTTAVDELRELSRGIHPSILTEGGLSPALKALGRRSPVRVKLDMGFEQRLPDHVEAAAYYTVSEALTNASKHANATRVWVSLRVDHEMLRLSIRDDGVGGADSNQGSGLTGLKDRIEA
ncbi:MAG TPA: GAF domain-containing protein, partial [Gaiellaceae bacterium]